VGTITWLDEEGTRHTLALTFTIFVGTEDDDWYPAELCVDDIPWVLDRYLALEHFSCCDMQGGYFMELDGVCVADGGLVDEFVFTMTWFRGLERLCRGSTEEQFAPREESRMTGTRVGAWLELEDSHLLRFRVPLAAFTAEILREAEHFVEFTRRLRAEIDRRRTTNPLPRLDDVVKNLPDRLEQKLTSLAEALAESRG
jgi:hypothetical protein